MNGTRGHIAVARMVAILAMIAGVLAMHSLTSGHDADLRTADMQTADMQTVDMQTVLAHAVPMQGVQAAHLEATDDRQLAGHGGRTPKPEPLNQSAHLLDVCLAILLVAATTLLLRALTRRRVWDRLVATSSPDLLTLPRVDRSRRPGQFMLGVLRT